MWPCARLCAWAVCGIVNCETASVIRGDSPSGEGCKRKRVCVQCGESLSQRGYNARYLRVACVADGPQLRGDTVGPNREVFGKVSREFGRFRRDSVEPPVGFEPYSWEGPA